MLLYTPNGWNKWIYAKSVLNGTQIPDATIPYLYAPATGFWIQSQIIHCLIPWTNNLGAFGSFLLAGGGSGTLAGAVSGLSAAASAANVSTMLRTFSLNGYGLCPSMGFCIGKKFKEQVYTKLTVMNNGLGGTDATYVGVDLLQNSKFKRVYLDHGSVVRYTVISNNNRKQYLLTLDFVKSHPPSPETVLAAIDFGSITISAHKDGEIQDIAVKILGMKDNWDFIISEPSAEILNGDYYKFSNMLCLENPYLLSGIWYGNEDDPSFPLMSQAASGMHLYQTRDTTFYQEGRFLGSYIWSNATSSTISVQPVVGSSMDDGGGDTWAFNGFGNSSDFSSNIYANDTRYKETNLDSPDPSTGAVVSTETRLVATNADLTTLLSSTPEPEYVRVEIGTGGSRNRHNWYSSCLAGEFLKTADKTHKILAHVSFNVIDVSFWDITKTSKFNPFSNQQYSIFNQSAWVISEHYDGRMSNLSTTGIFSGKVISSASSSAGSSIRITVTGNTSLSTWKKNGLSYIDRYTQRIQLPSSTKKAFGDFDGWKLALSFSNKAYDIRDVVFSSQVSETNRPYDIIVNLKESVTIETGARIYITFDTSYEVFGNFSKEAGFNLNLNVAAGLKGTPGYGEISNCLCLDGYFQPNPYKIDIASGDRIGMCDGFWFGLEGDGSAASFFNQNMYFSVPRGARGVASVFHTLRNEDWIAYQDAVNGLITVRRGDMNFTEYPRKSMIVIGKSQHKSPSGSSSPIELDTEYDMLRRVGITFGSSATPSSTALLFGLGSADNIYGFYVSGDGIVNLGFLTKMGRAAGTVPSSTYKGDDYRVSPVFTYLPAYYQNLETAIVDIGMKTTEGPLYIEGGEITDAAMEYVNENQTLSDTGYFDLVRLNDGEELLIYGEAIKAFTITGQLNNSSDNSSDWSNPNVIKIIGSFNDGYAWATPQVGRIDDEANTNQYALMVLNAVEYLACIYNSFNNTLALFVRCTMSGNIQNSYLGCYIINLLTLTNDNVLCEPYPVVTPPRVQKFMWRQPLLSYPPASKSEDNGLWTASENFIKGAPKSTVISDSFVRVMGSEATNSSVDNASEFGIISTAILPDGTYVVFYDSNVGIKALYSTTIGNSWFSTPHIYAKGGRSGVLIGDLLYYISPEGIKVKKTNITDFYSVINYAAGIQDAAREVELQRTLDSRNTVLIGSGVIEVQRLSGYVTPDGIAKIFFYDNRNLLKCMESKDVNKWIVANNF